MTEEVDDLRGKIAALQEEQGEKRPTFEQPVPPRERVRAHVTKVVIWGYIVAIGAIMAYLIFGPAPAGKDRYADLLDLIKVAALPVVTFVIGHYFGSESK